MYLFSFFVNAQIKDANSYYVPVDFEKTTEYFFIGMISFSIVFFVFCVIKFRSVMKAIRYSSLVFLASFTIYGLQSFNSMTSSTIRIDASTLVVPHTVKVLQLGKDSVEISWKTDKSTIQYITYESPGRNEIIALDVLPSKETSTHRVLLRNLERGVVYTYVIHYAKQEFTEDLGSPFQFELE